MTDAEREAEIRRHERDWNHGDVAFLLTQLDRARLDSDSYKAALDLVTEDHRYLEVQLDQARAELAAIRRDYVTHVNEAASVRDRRLEAAIAEGRSIARALREAVGALADLVRAWEKFGPSLATLSGKPTSLDRARAALERARKAAGT